MKRPIRKHSFLLVEVLCCLTLICIALFPMIKSCIKLYQLKNQELLKLKTFFIQQQALGEIKKKLYLQEYSFSKLKNGCIDCFEIGEVACKAKIHNLAHTDKPSLDRYGLLLEIDLHCDPSSQSSHKIFVEGVTQ